MATNIPQAKHNTSCKYCALAQLTNLAQSLTSQFAVGSDDIVSVIK